MGNDSKMEAWKLAVARAAAYVQSNASFQIQLFGFYASAVVISTSITPPPNANLMFGYIIPFLSFVVLWVSCYYFNRLTTQHVFIRLYGLEYNPSAPYKSPDHLWQAFRGHNQVSIWKSVYYIFQHDYTGPYPLFFLIYAISGIASVFYNFNNAWNLSICWKLLAFSASILICFFIVAALTNRAWRVIFHEENVNCIKADGTPLSEI